MKQMYTYNAELINAKSQHKINRLAAKITYKIAVATANHSQMEV